MNSYLMLAIASHLVDGDHLVTLVLLLSFWLVLDRSRGGGPRARRRRR